MINSRPFVKIVQLGVITAWLGTKKQETGNNKMTKIYSIFIFLVIVSCENRLNKNFSANEEDEGQRIEIYEDDISEANFSSVLKMKSFTKLSNDILLGKAQRVILKNNNLYISDSQPKIVCFNIENGNIKFEISRMGKGPGEFLRPISFENVNNGTIKLSEEEVARFNTLNENSNPVLVFYKIKNQFEL